MTMKSKTLGYPFPRLRGWHKNVSFSERNVFFSKNTFDENLNENDKKRNFKLKPMIERGNRPMDVNASVATMWGTK